ncbi:UV-B-induced protein chloroplastic-like [Heracleum sosnowskyi]|uniref:UV-B-induced protein chloroplastic-like n=1 Tax=Heracleum sosnowskyi TaxID=360622 RepID=A0AAD8JIR6_9APIA|nr:UV-B-induced protein chloroplastic-like [Heracleum sosnowskyi]
MYMLLVEFGLNSVVSKQCKHPLFLDPQLELFPGHFLALILFHSPPILGSSSVHHTPSQSHSAGDFAPLQLESPVGQFLSQILISHPHLVPAAVEQQLDQLLIDRDTEKQNENASNTGTDLVLYRRIAEVKHNERKKALEEILYALIVQKFMDANVSLVPAISVPSSDPSGRVDTWPHQDEKLEKLHSHEANEMIQNHLTFILGNRLSDSSSVAQVSKLKVGQVYAASVMYGYFLKRIDQRFQLEKTMKILPGGIDEERNIEQIIGDDTRPSVNNAGDSVGNLQPRPAWSGGMGLGGIGEGIRSSRLKTYVMSFDAETLQRYATIRSKEAIDIVEKHTEALFGKPEIVISPEGRVDSSKDENIKISLGGLRRLVLEAVTFGAFLWDVESHVDSRYHFVSN